MEFQKLSLISSRRQARRNSNCRTGYRVLENQHSPVPHGPNSIAMNIVINCPHCNQEMVIESDFVGQTVPCPTCSKDFAIPQGRPEEEVKAERAAAQPAAAPQPAAGAAPGAPKKEEKKDDKKKSMPSKEELDKLLPGANKSSPAAQAEGNKAGIRVKCVQHHLCIDMGKDLFGDMVAKILDPIDAEDIVNVSPISYSHKDSSGDILHDFGVMIIYNHRPEKKDQG